MKLKLAEVEVVVVAGPLAIVVCGGVVSGGIAAFTVQRRLAGVGSTFLAASIARTRNRWLPTPRPE
jgi:hypothetical protein